MAVKGLELISQPLLRQFYFLLPARQCLFLPYICATYLRLSQPAKTISVFIPIHTHNVFYPSACYWFNRSHHYANNAICFRLLVIHSSNNLAQCCLTSVIYWELVYSTRHGRGKPLTNLSQLNTETNYSIKAPSDFLMNFLKNQ